MQVSTFCEKLNKVDGNIYVVEEEIHLINGVYEAELQHDNINEATFAVFTGPKLTGERLESYTLSTPSLAPWKRIVRVYADVPVVYISYETDGDTVEGDDINRVQSAIVATQEALNTEESRALGAEKKLADDLQAEFIRAVQEEARLDGWIDAETKRAQTAEQVNSAAITAEANRAQAAEKALQKNIDGHTDAVNLEIQSLRAVDTALEEKKANAADVNRELGNRYTKDQVYTKAEVLKKIEDLIGAAPDTLDTFREIADALGNDPNFATTITTVLGGKVDKVSGKQLSSNDYTDGEKAELADVSSKKHTHGNKSVLDRLTEILLSNWTDAYNKRHEHGNKTVIDKITQTLLDNLANAYAHISNKANPHTVTKSQIGLSNVENKSSTTIRSEMTKEDVVAALGYTPPESSVGYTHPNSGVKAGTYRSVTVNAQGHVTAGSNPCLTWGDLKGV